MILLADILAWSSIAALLGFGLWRTGRYIHTAIKLRKTNFRRLVTGVALSVFVVAVLIFGVPYLANKFVDTTTPEAKFWMQTFAGNWSPDSFPVSRTSSESTQTTAKMGAVDAYWFSVSASIAFWLNNAIILVFIGFTWKVTKMARNTSIAAALVMRDSLTNIAAKKLVEAQFEPDERKKVLDIFKEAQAQGQSALEKHLPKINENGAELVDALRDPRQQRSGPTPG